MQVTCRHCVLSHTRDLSDGDSASTGESWDQSPANSERQAYIIKGPAVRLARSSPQIVTVFPEVLLPWQISLIQTIIINCGHHNAH